PSDPGVSVLEPAVVEELLAVVGGEDHERLREQAARLELGEEAAEFAIDERDLLVVGAAQELDVDRLAAAVRRADLCGVGALLAGRSRPREALAERCWRVVGQVRVE